MILSLPRACPAGHTCTISPAMRRLTLNSTYASMTDLSNTVVAETFNGSTVKPGTSCNMATYAPGTAADTAAYWRPVLYANGQAITSTVKDQLYYRAKPMFGTDFRAIPPDARLIVGNHSATSVETNQALIDGNLYWECDGKTSTHYTTAPNNCVSSGTESILENVVFPACWDGLPMDHTGPHGTDNNHFAYPVKNACPTSFPVKVPQLSEKFKFDGIPVGSHLQLSADPDGPLVEDGTRRFLEHVDGTRRFPAAPIRSEHVAAARTGPRNWSKTASMRRFPAAHIRRQYSLNVFISRVATRYGKPMTLHAARAESM
jgi:hypothetical protein